MFGLPVSLKVRITFPLVPSTPVLSEMSRLGSCWKVKDFSVEKMALIQGTRVIDLQ